MNIQQIQQRRQSLFRRYRSEGISGLRHAAEITRLGREVDQVDRANAVIERLRQLRK